MIRTTWRFILAFFLSLLTIPHLRADVILFGSGANQFAMNFQTIGSPGNAADTTGWPVTAGSVAYTYYMSKYEVSEDMIEKYNLAYGNANNVAITYINRSPDKPATSVSWYEAARFINWLNMEVGSPVAYRFQGSGGAISRWDVRDTANFDSNNPYRSKRAMFALPTIDEWYKAAYYSPSTGQYRNYATGSDQVPGKISAGTGTNVAVYGQPQQTGPAFVDMAGSVNEFGLMAMTGNVHEWMESAEPGQPINGSSPRVVRGGSWMSEQPQIEIGYYFLTNPSNNLENIGFRVMSLSNEHFAPQGDSTVPEPSTWAVLGLVSTYSFVKRLRAGRIQPGSQRARTGMT
jgi:sulfatase modifying factor 1